MSNRTEQSEHQRKTSLTRTLNTKNNKSRAKNGSTLTINQIPSSKSTTNGHSKSNRKSVDSQDSKSESTVSSQSSGAAGKSEQKSKSQSKARRETNELLIAKWKLLISNSLSTLHSRKMLINLNVGGSDYTTTQAVLCTVADCKLAKWFINLQECPLPKDANQRYFIDRDGLLFRYVLDTLRQVRFAADSVSLEESKSLVQPAMLSLTHILPENFTELARFQRELDFFHLTQLFTAATDTSSATLAMHRSTSRRFDSSLIGGLHLNNGHLTVGYHGTFNFGRQGMSTDVSFRKIARILISGRVSLAREVFGDTLNEGRDPDRGENEDRYSSRYFLKHTFLEQAFDALAIGGFRLASSCASGTNGLPTNDGKSSMMPGGGVGQQLTEEDRWMHYNEFVFVRP